MLHDQDIREPLFDYLDEIYGKNRIIEEKNMGKSRADIVMVTEDALFGVEIKSDADTYARLASQVRDYDRYYDFNYVVVGSSHGHHIREHVPDYWGVITVELVDEELDFYVLRKPSPNPKVTWKRKLEILWRPELAAIQDRHQMPKYKEKKKAFVIDRIVDRIEKGRIQEADLRREVSLELLERDYTSIEQALKDYRRGEIAKQLDEETDPEKRIELMAKRSSAISNLRSRRRPKGRKKRKY